MAMRVSRGQVRERSPAAQLAAVRGRVTNQYEASLPALGLVTLCRNLREVPLFRQERRDIHAYLRYASALHATRC